MYVYAINMLVNSFKNKLISLAKQHWKTLPVGEAASADTEGVSVNKDKKKLTYKHPSKRRMKST